MSNTQVSETLSQTAMSMEPLNEKRLELGKKVFKVPTQSKRRSTRIQRPEVQNIKKEKKAVAIVHHLLLAPTLKRQQKKKLEREKKTSPPRAKATKEWKWDFTSKSEDVINPSEIFVKKRRRTVKRKIFNSVLNDSDVHAVRKKKKTIDAVKIRHLARRGGVERIYGLGAYNDETVERRRQSDVPPPFEPRDGDPYIIPKPGELISYLWYTRPSPVLGSKQIYRTGVLFSHDGTIRFFENDNESVGKNEDERKYFEGRFYLNKQVFKKGNFRVRNDLVVGAICYERDMKLPCKIIKIDETCGAVLVESLKSQDNGIKRLWISPDDLVGNYEYSKTSNCRKGRKLMKSVSVKPTALRRRYEQKMAQIPPKSVSSAQVAIDLTQDDEFEEDPEVSDPLKAYQKSLDRHFGSKLESRLEQRDQSFISSSGLLERAMSRNSLPGSLRSGLDIGSTSLPNTGQLTFDNERFAAPTVPDVRKTLTSVSGLLGGDYRNQSLYDIKLANSVQRQSSLLGRTQPAMFRFADENMRARSNLSLPSTARAPGILDASLRAQTLSNRFPMMGTSGSALPQSGGNIQSELDLLKQHGKALEILMSARDLGTIVATLQFIKRVQQRGIPVGPTAAKLVSEAEMKSRALMEDTFLRHLTSPTHCGGKGYTRTHAGMILCRLAPVLGPNLGRVDSPPIDSARLMSFGLSRLEVLDILPYTQSFEDDILMKTLSCKRQLANGH